MLESGLFPDGLVRVGSPSVVLQHFAYLLESCKLVAVCGSREPLRCGMLESARDEEGTPLRVCDCAACGAGQGLLGHPPRSSGSVEAGGTLRPPPNVLRWVPQ